MILNRDARLAFENEDWQIVKEYIEFLEPREERLKRLEAVLNTMERDKDAQAILTKYFSEFKTK